jgi:4-hydroxybenzoyl-CoA thioesterase
MSHTPVPTPRTVVYTQRVEFGDCDPARIVWFPNFFRWIDAASRHFFIACGVPPWHETEKTTGLIGTPLVDTHARFIKTASYGDMLHIHVHVAEWRDKSFVQRYRVQRNNADGSEDLIMECDEVRIFAAHREDGKGIRAIPVPPDIKALCS